VFAAYTNKYVDVTVVGGIELRGLKANPIARRKIAGEPVLEEYKFIPYMDRAEVSLEEIERFTTHICLENNEMIKVKTMEFLDEDDNISAKELFSPLIIQTLSDIPMIQPDVNIFSANVSFKENSLFNNITIIDSGKINRDSKIFIAIGYKLLTPKRANNLALLMEGIIDNGFLITREDYDQPMNIEEEAMKNKLHVLMEKKVGKELIVLLKKQEPVPKKVSIVNVKNNNFDWIKEMQNALIEDIDKKTAALMRVIFVSEGDFESGM
jgi:fatty acid synthase